MSRNTIVVVECANCGSDFTDGTVGNRRHSKYCPSCIRAYGLAIDDCLKIIKPLNDLEAARRCIKEMKTRYHNELEGEIT